MGYITHQGRMEAVERALLDCDAGDNLIVCRALKGNHSGGRQCWCVPHVITVEPLQTVEDVERLILEDEATRVVH